MKSVTERGFRAPVLIAALGLGCTVITGAAFALPQDPPPAQQDDQARGEAAIAEARDHMANGRWQQAVGAWERALQFLPGNTEAVQGLADANAQLQQGETGQDVADTQETLRGQARAEFAEGMRTAREYLAEENYARAERAVLTARIQLEQRRSILPATEYNRMIGEADSLATEIASAEALAEQVAQQQIEEAARREQERQALEAAMERQAQINRRMERVRELQAEMKYAEALQVVDEILALDENYAGALLLHDLLSSQVLYQEYDKVQMHKQWSIPQLELENQTALIPPTRNLTGPGQRSLNTIITYPEDWPELSYRRIADTPLQYGAADSRTRGVLASARTPIDFRGNTFGEVVDWFRQVTKVDFDPDWRALALIGVQPTDEITLQLRDVSAETALDRVLADLGDDLDRPVWDVKDGIVAISTRDALDTDTETVVRDIRDLLHEVPYFDDAPALGLEATYELVDDNNAFADRLNTPTLTRSKGSDSADIFGDPVERTNDRTMREEKVQDLIGLVQRIIEPESWREMGGNVGSIEEMNGNLIITHTPRALQQIDGLLGQLREIQNLQINVESRFLDVSTDWFEQIGVDLDLYFNTNNNLRQQQLAADPLAHLSDFFGPDGRLLDPLVYGGINDTNDGTGITNATAWGQAFGIPDPTLTNISYITGPVGAPIRTTQGFTPLALQQGHFDNVLSLVELTAFAQGLQEASPALSLGIQFLDDIQVDLLIEATQADHRSVVLTAPRLTFFNGQRAWVAIVFSQAFVSNLIPITGDGAVAFQPIPSVLNQGFVLDVEGVISADRRYVTMTVIASLAQNATFETAEIQGAVAADSLTGGGTAGQISSEITLPQMEVSLVQTTVSVPDKGTILLGGQRKVTEIEVETGVPVLSKIPFLNRFFTNRVTAKEEKTLLVLIRPEIIIQQENEELLFPGLLDSLGGAASYMR